MISPPTHNPHGNLRLIVAVDFNGVIHDHPPGFKGKCEPGSPAIPGAIAWLKEIAEEYDVFLVSASFSRADFITAAKAWLEATGIPRPWMMPVLTGRSKLTLTPFKPPCQIFVDDRGFCFQGEFPSVSEIKAFKPWNR